MVGRDVVGVVVGRGLLGLTLALTLVSCGGGGSGDDKDAAVDGSSVDAARALDGEVPDAAQPDGSAPDATTTPTLSIADVSVAEGNSGAASAAVVVTLSASATQTVTVDFATANGTASTAAAIGGPDYDAAAGTLTFAPGETAQTLLVSVNGDSIDEVAETLTVALSSPTGATIADGSATVTITNDDTAPAASVDDVLVIEGNAGAVAATFTVSLSEQSGRTVTMMYASADGTAAAPGDYVAIPATALSFNPGELLKTVTVTINGDTTQEPNETFTLALSSPSGATLAKATGTATIQNDDGVVLPSLSISGPAAAAEGNATRSATFTVTLSAAASQVVTVDYATQNSTAIASGNPAAGGQDFVAAAGTLSFAVGETSKTIAVTVNGDQLFESDEAFRVLLSGAVNANVTTASATASLTNDDAQPAASIGDVSIGEGDGGQRPMTFAVTLSAAAGTTTSLTYASSNGTAVAQVSPTPGSGDYNTATGTLTFPAGISSQSITVVVNGDAFNEADETVTITLTASTTVTLADGTAVGTIVNDDAVPTLAVADQQRPEGNAGTSLMTFQVTLSAVSARTVTVAYATGGSTASAGTDYQGTSGTLTFAPGTTTRPVAVTVNGDTMLESSETFVLTLSAPSNATLASATATGTISDDDQTFVVNIADASLTEGNAGASAVLMVPVTLSAPPTMQTTVVCSLSAGSSNPATTGTDFSGSTQTVTFAVGEQLKYCNVTILGDVLDEFDETVRLTLSAPVNCSIGDGTGVATITDDDALPSLSIAGTSVIEGNTGTATASFAVTLSAASGRTVSASFATSDGSARTTGAQNAGGSDYIAATGTVTFAAGETAKTISVTVRGDTTYEVADTFRVTLSAAVNASLAVSNGMGSISNDDPQPVLNITDISTPEGTGQSHVASLFVTLSGTAGDPVTFQWATANGQAGGADFVPVLPTLVTIDPGDTVVVLGVTILGDPLLEVPESFTINLSSPTVATIGDGIGQIIILNDD